MLTALLTMSVFGQVGAAPITQTGGSCAVQSTSRGGALLNPNTGSDERFFARPNGAPNILFLIDTSAGALGWANGLPTANGCGDDSFAPGYDHSKAYEPVVKKVDADNWPLSTGSYNSDWFKYGRIYDMPADANYGHNLKDDPAGVVSNWATVVGACNPTACITACGADAVCSAACTTNSVTCATCLVDKGFYRGNINGTTRTVAVGNFLNFYGPKYVAVSQVLSQLVRDVQNVRFGIMTSYKWDNKAWANGSGMDPIINMSMMEKFWPSCSKAYDVNKKFKATDTEPQRNSVLNNISNDSDADFTGDNSISSMLYGAGWYYASRSPWPPEAFNATYTWPAPLDHSGDWKEGSTNQKSVCDACVYSSIIYLNASPVDPTKDLKMTLPAFATTIGGTAAASCDVSTNTRCNSKADEIAAWLYRNDFREDYGGNQRVTTYVINIDSNSETRELLRSVAKMGGGKYFAAQSNGELKQAVLDAIEDISNRGQTFATSAVTSIQTGQLQLTQLVPRMYPQRGLPWNGELYRYSQRNEFVEEIDFNGDGDKGDVFVVDADNSVVVESVDGFFKKANSYSDLTPSIANANPYWEVSARLKVLGWQNRRIWTVVDRDDGRASFTHQDGLVEFKKANWDKLIHTLGLGRASCPTLTDPGPILNRLNLSVANLAALLGIGTPATDAGLWQLCAMTVIDYVRGRDLADEDGDGDRNETRDSVMADIFHSSPIVVEPPSERFICDLGISNQCTKTLYASSLPVTATELDTSTSYDDPLCKQADGTTAIAWTDPYDIYRAKNRARDRLVVVGSNGGMFHVFNNGKVKGTTKACSGVAWSAEWDQGTGDEEYAFIPPDLLPKLQDMVVNGHEYYVDGDLMVRDIWADGSGSTGADGKKQWDEYHTMVIGAEGRGGPHYYALELQWLTDTNTSGTISNPLTTAARPFRWIFPQPGTLESTKMGKALFTLSPKPPPIGPVLLQYSGTGKVSRYGVDTREAWVTMLSGGWSPALNRGRGLYMVDAYWGVVNGREDNLYWKAELDVNATGNTDAPLSAMSGSFAAPVAMVDYGANDAVRQDGFFDSAVVGDTVGQLWVARFFAPGAIANDTSGTLSNEGLGALAASVPYLPRGAGPGIVNNWSVARAFEMDKNATYSGNYKNIANVQSFFYLPSIAIEPATLSMRALIGTGNRYALLEPYSGLCRWDNLMACAKFGCDEISVDLDIERAPTEIEGQWNRFKRRQMTTIGTDRIETGPETRTYCEDDAELNYEDYTVKKCNQKTGGDVDYGNLNSASIHCGSQLGYGFNCRMASGTQKLTDLRFNIDTAYADANGKDRYYGLWVYGGSRVFDETGATAPQAKAFDTARLTDRGGTPSVGDLLNVTNTVCPQIGACTGTVGTSNLGWFYEYTDHGIKTATGSAILASCALWSTLNPGAEVVGGTEACTSSVATSSFFQADFITGEPNCAVGFQDPGGGNNARFLTRQVLTPPPEPATVVQISKSGQVRYSAQLPEPGKGAQYQVDVVGGGDVLQSVYELPITRSTHNCRHNQTGKCVPVP